MRDAGHFGSIAQVTIVGAGLLGGSMGLGLRAAGYRGRIIGVGRRLESLAKAKSLGCVDEITTDLQARTHEPSQLIVLATPLGAFEDLLGQIARIQQPGWVITDVGSTKRAVCEAAGRLLPRPERFIGSHPMAGGEQHGPEKATADLFRDKPCIITAGADADAEALGVVRSLWRVLGARLLTMSPAEHDRQVAMISHLPHALAVLLVELAARDRSLTIASTGFRDTTRVASGDAGVWADVFTSNREAVLAASATMRGELERLEALLRKNDREAIMELLSRNKAVRDRWVAGASAGLD